MPLDITKTLLDATNAALDARAPIAALRPGNRIKTAAKDNVNRAATRVASADFPTLSVTATGKTFAASATTFAIGGNATIDYGVPLKPTVSVVLILDKNYDSATTPLEAECEAAFLTIVDALRAAGNRWVGGVVPKSTRKPEKNADTGGQLRTVVRWTLTFDCRVKRSLLIAT